MSKVAAIELHMASGYYLSQRGSCVVLKGSRYSASMTAGRSIGSTRQFSRQCLENYNVLACWMLVS
jgi:hypothetical protein